MFVSQHSKLVDKRLRSSSGDILVKELLGNLIIVDDDDWVVSSIEAYYFPVSLDKPVSRSHEHSVHLRYTEI